MFIRYNEYVMHKQGARGQVPAHFSPVYSDGAGK